VFESQDRGQAQNMTDKRFFWLALYCQPALWVVLGVLALVRFKNPIWLILIGKLWVFFSGMGRARGRGRVEMLRVLAEGLRGMVGCEVLADGCASYCSDAYDHEYACVLAVRQVQSGFEPGFECVFYGESGEECGGRAGEQDFQ